jgi:glycosyltransferase involved in cell wall biosynthesis
LNDERISEIIISDDCSAMDVYQTIIWKYNGIDKVKISRNEQNLDCYRNKKRAIELASNEWVIIFDSDNILTKKFVDTIFSQHEWNRTWAYTPDFAKPHFDFRALDGVALSHNNIASYLPNGNCGTMLNAMNYFVNRNEYLRVWNGNIDPVTSDSIFQNYNWLKAGNSIYITPGLEYEHRVHSGSHYQQNQKRTPRGFHEDIIEKLKSMK